MAVTLCSDSAEMQELRPEEARVEAGELRPLLPVDLQAEERPEYSASDAECAGAASERASSAPAANGARPPAGESESRGRGTVMAVTWWSGQCAPTTPRCSMRPG